jgi:hypothetical protein
MRPRKYKVEICDDLLADVSQLIQYLDDHERDPANKAHALSMAAMKALHVKKRLLVQIKEEIPSPNRDHVVI